MPADAPRDNRPHKPQNTRLWDMIVNLAKQKFRVYPSQPASKWVHDEYIKRGGRFVASETEDDRHDKGGKLSSAEAAKARKKKAEDKKKAASRKG